MNILGISGQERDAAAALIQDGRVVAAIEEEKLGRIRHIGMNYAGGLPFRAVEFCLERGGISLDKVDYVAYYLEPHKRFHREIAFNSSRAINAVAQGAIEEFPAYFVDSLNDLKQRLKTRRLVESLLSEQGKFLDIPHHLAHGASAFFSSGFQHAAVISVDNKGDMTSAALMTGGEDGLHLDAEAKFPDSIGMVYNTVTAALGFDGNGDWHKTMWLAPTGKPVLDDLFEDILRVDANGLPVINPAFFVPPSIGTPALSRLFFEQAGLNPRTREDPVTQKHRDLAASVQKRVEDVLCDMAKHHRERTGEDNLCIAGGVALNSLAVSAVERRSGFSGLFVQPAAGNAGCSLGAGLYVWHQTLGNRERVYQMRHAFLGPQFNDEDIKGVLDNCKIAYEYFLTEDKLIAEVARSLAQDKIVGWFRGAMEFGPRSLGARSILASPISEMMRDNLNAFIKHREDFRPFCASVPEEHTEEFFEASALNEFLQGVSRIRDGKSLSMPAAVFGEGLVRVHNVSRKTNPSFWKLLTKFAEHTGVPVLLNTSFNLFGEPVVSTPREAVRGFYCSGIDCLAIGNFLIKK